MMKKLASFVLLFALFVIGFGVAHADVATPVPFPTFPAGCSSGLGFSITNGLPCNGRSVATMSPMIGCATAIGYSVTNGTACDGIGVAIPYLAGCTSTLGYSTITAQPCNGTAVADMSVVVPSTVPPLVVTTPGLPVTGAGGNASGNVALLLISLCMFTVGTGYLVYRGKTKSA